MTILDRASAVLDVPQFDLVLDAINAEIEPDVAQFISPRSILKHVRKGGIVPKFLMRYCRNLMVEHNTPMLLKL